MTLARRAIAAAVVIVATGCDGGAPPRLELGTVATERAAGPAGGELARVEVANVGGRVLVLDGIRVDCGCRLVSALPETLARGERTAIVVQCRRATSTDGSHEIRIASNDPQRAEAVARFAAPRGEHHAFEPSALYFGYVPVGGSATREIALAADATTAGAPIAREAELQVETRPPHADGRHVVRVRFTPHAAGPFHGTLTLDGRPAIAVSGVGYRGVLAFPAELTLPSEVSPGAPPAIALKYVGPAALEIGAIETPPGVTAELQTTTPGREFRLVVRAHGPLAPDAALRLRTSDAEEPLVTIRLRDVGA